MLSAEEMRTLLDSIDTHELIGLRDRALIGLMGYTFARVSAAAQMKVEDYYVQNRRGWVRLHEKGGRETSSNPPSSAPTKTRCPRHRFSCLAPRLRQRSGLAGIICT